MVTFFKFLCNLWEMVDENVKFIFALVTCLIIGVFSLGAIFVFNGGVILVVLRDSLENPKNGQLDVLGNLGATAILLVAIEALIVWLLLLFVQAIGEAWEKAKNS